MAIVVGKFGTLWREQLGDQRPEDQEGTSRTDRSVAGGSERMRRRRSEKGRVLTRVEAAASRSEFRRLATSKTRAGRNSSACVDRPWGKRKKVGGPDADYGIRIPRSHDWPCPPSPRTPGLAAAEEEPFFSVPSRRATGGSCKGRECRERTMSSASTGSARLLPAIRRG